MKNIAALLTSVMLLGLAIGEARSDAGWVPLFNGKDLASWNKNGDEKWVVEQDTILCESAANKYGYLTTVTELSGLRSSPEIQK